MKIISIDTGNNNNNNNNKLFGDHKDVMYLFILIIASVELYISFIRTNFAYICFC